MAGITDANGMAEAQSLLAQHRYRDAASALDDVLIRNKQDDQAWYLRGLASLKLRSYDAAQEHFERALSIRKKPEYHRMQGFAHFEIFELDAAVTSFLEAIELDENDATSHVFAALCYMLLDDPRAKGHIAKAREVDQKKTRQLLSNFFAVFIENDPQVSNAHKKKIKLRIDNVA